MCRLSAITTTDIPAGTKQLIMHFMMVAASADDNQAHGAGVSDGEAIFKSGQNYIRANGLSWLRQLNPNAPWIGHVRKPSSGTSGADSYASHPYGLDNQGNAFVGIHNGWVAGTIGWRKDEPDTDSWRAFKALEKIALGRELTPEHIQTWLRTFETGTSSSFLFLQHDRLIGVRGLRTLYRYRLKNGWVINTSRHVLDDVRAVTNMFVKDIGEVEEIPEAIYFDSTGITEPLDLTLRLARNEVPVTWRRGARRKKVLPTP